MSLPQVQTPTFSLKLPSDKRKIVFRPFQVREEKILLVAQQSEDSEEQIRAVKQILQNCILEPEDIDINNLASFDIEYIFLKLRAKSVGEKVEVQIYPRKREGFPAQDVEIDIDKIEPTYDENHKKHITLDDNISIQMRYPTFEMIEKIKDPEDPSTVFEVIRDSIYAIYEGETVYEIKDFSQEEVEEFLNNLSAPQLEKLQYFFTTLPKLQTTIHYKQANPEDSNDIHEEDIVLEGLMSFLS